MSKITIEQSLLTYYNREYNSRNFQDALDHELAMTGERTTFSQYVTIMENKRNDKQKSNKSTLNKNNTNELPLLTIFLIIIASIIIGFSLSYIIVQNF